MTIIRKLIVALTMVTGLFAAGAAVADTNVSTGLTGKGTALAVHGYDVVAYFTQGQPIRGRAKYSVVYKDATYRFANKEHFEAFDDDPQKYVPQYGGYCAYGVSVGAKFDGDPHLWKVVDGKLYLNLNEGVQKIWAKDVPGNIEKADRNWKQIARKAPKELS